MNCYQQAKQISKTGEKITFNRESRRFMTVLVIFLFICLVFAQKAIAAAVIAPIGRALNMADDKINDLVSTVTNTAKKLFYGVGLIALGTVGAFFLWPISLPAALIVGGAIALTGALILNRKAEDFTDVNLLGEGFQNQKLNGNG